MGKKKDKLFHFKKFSVRHDRSGMKVGTDGVLLGAWANVSHTEHILDIGTGTGVIALMLAQRTSSETKIDAVEIEASACEDAQENFEASPWKEKLTLHAGSIHSFKPPHLFDLIVSNPPYFQNSFKPPSQLRETARHTESLQFLDLLNVSNTLLKSDGRLSVILPFEEGRQFISLARQMNLHCSRNWSFHSRSHKPIERMLLEFSRQKSLTEVGEIVLLDEGEDWSEQYKNMTRDFYLKL